MFAPDIFPVTTALPEAVIFPVVVVPVTFNALNVPIDVILGCTDVVILPAMLPARIFPKLVIVMFCPETVPLLANTNSAFDDFQPMNPVTWVVVK